MSVGIVGTTAGMSAVIVGTTASIAGATAGMSAMTAATVVTIAKDVVMNAAGAGRNVAANSTAISVICVSRPAGSVT